MAIIYPAVDGVKASYAPLWLPSLQIVGGAVVPLLIGSLTDLTGSIYVALRVPIFAIYT